MGFWIEDTGISLWNFLTFKGEDPKYIAQAGVLRGEPDGITGRCAVFRYGPGLKSYWIVDPISLTFHHLISKQWHKLINEMNWMYKIQSKITGSFTCLKIIK